MCLPALGAECFCNIHTSPRGARTLRSWLFSLMITVQTNINQTCTSPYSSFYHTCVFRVCATPTYTSMQHPSALTHRDRRIINPKYEGFVVNRRDSESLRSGCLLNLFIINRSRFFYLWKKKLESILQRGIHLTYLRNFLVHFSVCITMMHVPSYTRLCEL